MKIHSPNQQTAVVDTRYVPRASLLQYVDGSAWEVTYYSQILGRDSEPGPWAIDRSATDQQYVRISNMELKVTSPLTASEEEPGRSHNVSGTATVYPTHKPNIGDMFVADIGDGRLVVFAVDDVQRKTYMKDSYSEITYSVVDYVDSRPEITSDLNRKTQKRTVFMREFLQWGQNPLLLEGEFADLMEMKKIYRNLVNFYFKDFFSVQYKTLLIPNQKRVAYDPFVTNTMLELVTSDEVQLINQARRVVVSANRNTDSYTLWDAVMRMDVSYLGAAIQQVRLLDTTAFRGMPEVSSIYYTGINLVACPQDARNDVDSPYDASANCFSSGSLLQATGLRWQNLLRYLPSSNLEGFFKEPVDAGDTLQELPDIVPVTIDEYYVLSEKFYVPSGPMASKLEVLVKQGLSGEAIDKVTLLSLARNCMKWPNLERFYYMPLLFALMKVATRTN